MFPQQFQGQAFTPQGIWGNPQLNLNDVVNTISRILPLLQLQGSPFAPQAGAFGFPQAIGQFGQQFPLQTAPWAIQGSAFTPQATNLVDVVNVLSRILPVLQQTVLQQAGLLGQPNLMGQPSLMGQHGQFGQPNVFGQSNVPGQYGAFGFPQQHFAPQHFAAQGINPEIAGVISRILPYLGTQTNPLFQTGVTGFGASGNPYIH